MKLTVCIGSSCHLKGSRQIVEKLQALLAEHQLQEAVELNGTFCLANCRSGVSVTLDDQLFSLTPDGVDAFFAEHVRPDSFVRS